MEHSGLGTTVLVDEILSDALQKLRSGDILPDESSFSLAAREPVARSTSVTHPTVQWGYRSYTDDVLKSFIDRSTSFGRSASFDALRTDKAHSDPSSSSMSAYASIDSSHGVTSNRSSDPGEVKVMKSDDPFINSTRTNVFAKQPTNGEFDSSDAFVSGEKMFEKFDADQRRCQEENLFQDQTAPKPEYDVGLSYFLGVILPGIATHFDIPTPPSLESGPGNVTSFLNTKPLPMCCISLRNQGQGGLRLTVTPPRQTSGNILIEAALTPQITVKFTALSLLPMLALPDQVVLPPEIPTRVALRPLVLYSQPVTLQVRSAMATPQEVTLLPSGEDLQVEVTAREGDTTLSLQLLSEGEQVATLQTHVEVRFARILLRADAGRDMSIVTVENEESFAVEVLLSDEVGGLVYVKKVRVAERQTAQVTVRRMYVRHNQPEIVAEIRAELLSPMRSPLPLTKCRVMLASRGGDIRPDLARFVWLAEKDFVFTMSENDQDGRRKLSPWKNAVSISPCHLISSYIQVLEEPDDPTKVLLRVSCPPRLTVGRLRFYRRSEGANAEPYGFRYPILAPEIPSLLWYAASENTTSRIYRMPLDGKLRVSNTGRFAVFVVIANVRGDGQVIAPGASTELRLREPCRILYGLECWRSLVRHRTSSHQAEIQAQIDYSDEAIGLEPKNLMTKFSGETHESLVDKLVAEKIPDDPQSLVRLYRLFMSTVEEVFVQGSEPEASTFFAPR
ncbi:hypothetical protein BIW11_08818 [Tropilaelaps mercedesae]|uniref:Uncharacterized protein n=1 Tax=Tropilaelaps mercedesae TaxID=418985 RepID=A0A1V9XMZ9_9ACAR|nr:hypothetical protein BIW11_08818 [Tropilaelaps mercedesae]